MAPFFSVIVPAYNAAPYVGETVESVLGQSCEDLELIVVDHGSEDETRAVVEALADERTRTFSIPQSGRPAVARNYGIGRASGKFVAFLDADDTWHPEKLKRCREVIDQQGAEFLFTNLRYMDRESRLGPVGGPSRFGRNDLLPKGDPLFLVWNMAACSSVVVSRALLERFPFDERRELATFEDHFLWLRLHREVPLHYLPEHLLNYRVHSANAALGSRSREHIDRYYDLVLEEGLFCRREVELARNLDYLAIGWRRGSIRALAGSLLSLGWDLRKPSRGLLLRWVKHRLRAGLLRKIKSRIVHRTPVLGSRAGKKVSVGWR